MITLRHETILVNAIERIERLLAELQANRAGLRRLRPSPLPTPALAEPRDGVLRGVRSGPGRPGDGDASGAGVQVGMGEAADGHEKIRWLTDQAAPRAPIPILSATTVLAGSGQDAPAFARNGRAGRLRRDDLAVVKAIIPSTDRPACDKRRLMFQSEAEA